MDKDTKNLLFCMVAMGGVFLSSFLNPPEGLTPQGVKMLAITLAAAFLWITEAVSIGVTGLIIIFLEALTGILPLIQGLAFLAHPVNTVVLVGFLLAAILVKSGLDVRIGLTVISKMGERTDRLVLGIFIATAALSMWMSNTATTAIMIPISMGILNMVGTKPGQSNLGKVMFIGIAYAANIGGMGTPTGTPANPIAIALLDSLAGIKLSFFDWMIRAVPVVAFLVPISWLLLLKVYPLEIKEVKGGLDYVEKQLREKGPLTKQEKKVLFFFIFAIVLWLMDSFIPLSKDWLYIVSIFLTIILVFPRIGFLSWKEAQNEIGWDVLFLVGGGLAMGTGLKNTGVIDWIAGILSSGMGQMPEGMAVALISAITGGIGITVFCTLSGTATTFVPIAIGLALNFGWNPVVFAITAGISSSFAFTLPANTAPNALVYGTGYFKTSEMFKSGIILVFISVFVVSFLTGYIIPLVF